MPAMAVIPDMTYGHEIKLLRNACQLGSSACRFRRVRRAVPTPQPVRRETRTEANARYMNVR